MLFTATEFSCQKLKELCQKFVVKSAAFAQVNLISCLVNYNIKHTIEAFGDDYSCCFGQRLLDIKTSKTKGSGAVRKNDEKSKLKLMAVSLF